MKTRNRLSILNQTAWRVTVGVWLNLSTACVSAASDSPQSINHEIGRFKAVEADQAVAVDEHFFYAIDNHDIGKYEKLTGRRVGGWHGEDGGPVIHLNSGVVKDGKLYCAHSNYPGTPMVSSIEVWDTETMEHVASHSFGIYAGSCTWLDFLDGYTWVAFVHYGRFSVELGTDPRWTTIIKFDEGWQQQEAWVFPQSVLKRFSPYSNSGGAWGPGGYIYATGHDLPELYVLKLPEAGSVLELVETIAVTNSGQGIAWDRSDPGVLYSIERENAEVIVSRISGPQAERIEKGKGSP